MYPYNRFLEGCFIYSLCVSVYVFVVHAQNCQCTYLCMHMQRPEDSMSSVIFPLTALRWGLSLNQSYLFAVGGLASQQTPRATCFHFPVMELHALRPCRIFIQVWRFKLRSSCLTQDMLLFTELSPRPYFCFSKTESYITKAGLKQNKKLDRVAGIQNPSTPIGQDRELGKQPSQPKVHSVAETRQILPP